VGARRRRDRELTAGHDHLGPGPLPGQGTAAPPAAPAREPGIPGNGKPIRKTTPADPGFGLGVFQITTPSTGTVWYYEGGTLGYRVVHFYFPRSGIIIALATNSATDPNTNDDLQATAIAVYQTLQKAGVARAG
jgi:hypothetical protein